jgi:hypothetical protein
MLKSKLIVALSLAALAGVAQAGTPSKIALDGYCDGFTNIMETGNGTISAMYDATACDGVTTFAAGGPTGKNLLGSGAGAALTLDSYAAYGVTLGFTLNKDNTWAVYDATGAVYNSGTWTKGKPGATALAGAKAALQR